MKVEQLVAWLVAEMAVMLVGATADRKAARKVAELD